jgi:hypothetical protein
MLQAEHDAMVRYRFNIRVPHRVRVSGSTVYVELRGVDRSPYGNQAVEMDVTMRFVQSRENWRLASYDSRYVRP